MINSRLQQLEEDFLASGGTFKNIPIKQLFDVSGTTSLDEGYLTFLDEGINFVGRVHENNGVKGKIATQSFPPNEAFTITATVIGNYKYVKYQQEPYYTSQNINKLTPRYEMNKGAIYYLITEIQNFVSLYDKQQGGYKLDDINEHLLYVPVKDTNPDFSYMEKFITELQAERLQELQAERLQELQGYLRVTGLSNYTLTDEEQSVIDNLEHIEWGTFNVEKLFGKSTRGKRLKSADRISGDLPFVTAGENDTGISAFIGNDVDIFKANTITIDMFGSAKYRNYQYGADDHIAVVHCDELPKEAVFFLTSAIHKVSNAGQFSYSNNFYAKDADELNVSLPIKNEKPDYELMKVFGSAIQKLIIADVVKFADKELKAYKQVIS